MLTKQYFDFGFSEKPTYLNLILTNNHNLNFVVANVPAVNIGRQKPPQITAHIAYRCNSPRATFHQAIKRLLTNDIKTITFQEF